MFTQPKTTVNISPAIDRITKIANGDQEIGFTQYDILERSIFVLVNLRREGVIELAFDPFEKLVHRTIPDPLDEDAKNRLLDELHG